MRKFSQFIFGEKHRQRYDQMCKSLIGGNSVGGARSPLCTPSSHEHRAKRKGPDRNQGVLAHPCNPSTPAARWAVETEVPGGWGPAGLEYTE